MQVQATAEGYYRRKRKIGEVFEYEGRIDGSSWLIPADATVQESQAKKPEEDDTPRTMHEIAQRGGRPFGSHSKKEG